MSRKDAERAITRARRARDDMQWALAIAARPQDAVAGYSLTASEQAELMSFIQTHVMGPPETWTDTQPTGPAPTSKKTRARAVAPATKIIAPDKASKKHGPARRTPIRHDIHPTDLAGPGPHTLGIAGPGPHWPPDDD